MSEVDYIQIYFTTLKKKSDLILQATAGEESLFHSPLGMEEAKEGKETNDNLWWASGLWIPRHTSHLNSPTGTSVLKTRLHYHSQTQALQDNGLQRASTNIHTTQKGEEKNQGTD